MDLNYTLAQLTEITNGCLIGNADFSIKSIIIDSRSPIVQSNTLFIALNGHKSNGHKYCSEFIDKGGNTILVSEEQVNLNCNQIVVVDTLAALQAIAEFHRNQFKIPVIGITGSNGKTTVKEWLNHVVKTSFNICRSPKSYNSQIGVPLSVLELKPHHDLAIFEAAISMPNEMETLVKIIKPTIGLFTGIGDAHQQNFESVEQKEKEKLKLFKNVDYIIKPNHNHLEFDIPFNDLASKKNSALVYDCALHLGLTKQEVLNSLKTLPSISMRMEKMKGSNGNIIINDAYTFTQKSLEIGIQYVNLYQNDKSKVLIIASSNARAIEQNLLNSFDKIILIGEPVESISNVFGIYSSTDDFNSNTPLLYDSIVLITGSRHNNLEKIVPGLTIKKHITKLNINLSKLRHNINYYRSKIAENVMILGMVKAQSYGGGIVQMAQFLESEKINYLGVAYTDEGVILRKNGVTTPIIVMNPEPNSFEDIITYNLEPSIYSLELLNEFIRILISRQISAFPIHLKLDTGMNRLGFTEGQLKDLLSAINIQPEVYVKSVFSHLSVADDNLEKQFSLNQIVAFENMCSILHSSINYSFFKHIANSAATLNIPSSHFDMVRIGIGMYGLLNEHSKNLSHVISFESEISQIKVIKKGDSVGYGRQHIAESDQTIAIVPVGYADGLSRGLSKGKWHLRIGNKSVPIIGNICMDMCMIDISQLNCQVGDSVEIFGIHNSIFEMAEKLKTIPYEIITSISQRVQRIFYTEG